MSIIDNKGPVSHPQLNSVPSRPFVLDNATIMHTRQLTASQSWCFPGFFIHRPPIMRGRFDSLTFTQERDDRSKGISIGIRKLSCFHNRSC